MLRSAYSHSIFSLHFYTTTQTHLHGFKFASAHVCGMLEQSVVLINEALAPIVVAQEMRSHSLAVHIP